MAKEEKAVVGRQQKEDKAVLRRQPKEEKAVARRQPKDDKGATRRQPNAIQRYITETIGELRKVKWPSRKEATNLTVVVLIVTFSMSAFLGLLDFLFTRLFALIIG